MSLPQRFTRCAIAVFAAAILFCHCCRRHRCSSRCSCVCVCTSNVQFQFGLAWPGGLPSQMANNAKSFSYCSMYSLSVTCASSLRPSSISLKCGHTRTHTRKCDPNKFIYFQHEIINFTSENVRSLVCFYFIWLYLLFCFPLR